VARDRGRDRRKPHDPHRRPLDLEQRSPGRNPCSDFFDNTLAAAVLRHCHEILDAGQIRTRFPQFDVRANETGYYEPDAGFLRPEACVKASCSSRRSTGADPHRRAGEEFSQARGVVTVPDREQYQARQLVVAAGPWVRTLLPPDQARLFAVAARSCYST
jgi:glycine/D-amino acid oxidase-like deaminating enzyme